MKNARWIALFLILFSLPALTDVQPVVLLPKTGQTSSYASGDDGSIQSGVTWPSPRFLDNGDGTITDRLTGLMWLKSDYTTYDDWVYALNLTDKLNQGQTYFLDIEYTANFTDWRMPNVNELETLLNFGQADMAGWLNSQGFSGINQGTYCTTTTAPTTGFKLVIDFYDGEITTSSGCLGLPVRGPLGGKAKVWKTGQTASLDPRDDGGLQVGVAWPTPRFTDNGNNTVTDNLTGLVWYKNANAFSLLNWTEAMAAIAALNTTGLDGATQWRAPNRRELHSLLDYSQDSPCLPAGHPFTNVRNNFYWGSTTRPNDTNKAYGVFMSTGRLYHRDKEDPNVWMKAPVWPVSGEIIDPPDPNIQVSPTSLDFGTVTAGNAVDKTVTVSNTGQSNLYVYTVAKSQPLTAPFSIHADNCSNTTIPAGDSADITVRFLPNASGNFSQTFEITSDDPDTSQVLVQVEGSGFVEAPPETAANSDATHAEHDDPISTATGEFYFETRDITLGGLMDLSFRRYYASILGQDGTITSALGMNWMHNYDQTLTIDGDAATLIYYKGKKITFTKTGSNWIVDQPQPYLYQMIESGSNYKFVDPTVEWIFTFNAAGKLIGIEDRNGNTLTLSYSGDELTQVSDGLGRVLNLTYTAGKLTGVADQTARSINFGYTGDYLTSYTDARGNTTTYSYTEAGTASGPYAVKTGLLTSTLFPEGNTPFSQAYDADGRVISQTDSAGNVSQLAFNTPALGVTTVTDALGNTMEHTHAARKSLYNFKDKSGQAIGIEYDGSSRRTKITDSEGAETNFDFHTESGKLSSFTDAEGNASAYSYDYQLQGEGFKFYPQEDYADAEGNPISSTRDNSGNILFIEDQLGQVWNYTYNDSGQVLTETNPLGGITTFAYHANGKLHTVTDDSGNTTTFEYDTQGRLISKENADSSTRSFTYDGNDNLLSSTDELGRTTSFTYDKNNLLRTTTDPLGKTVTFTYNGCDQLIEVEDQLLQTWTYTYDKLRRLKTFTNPEGETITFGYNAEGWLTSTTDPAGNAVANNYNKEGILTSTTDPLSHTTRLTPDKLGQITHVSSPLNHQTRFKYDVLGQLLSSLDPEGRQTAYEYDAAGLLTGITLPDGSSSAYDRNAMGQINQITDPAGSLLTKAYDQQGRLIEENDALSATSSYTYDALNRIANVDLPASSLALTYDAAGNVTRRLYSDGTDITYAYDANDRLLTSNGVNLGYDDRGGITSSNGIAIERDTVGRLSKITLAAGKSVIYSYNNRGLVSQVDDWAGDSTTLTYDAAGNISTLTRPSGITTHYSYDVDGNLSRLQEKDPQTISDIALTHNGAGEITSSQKNIPLNTVPPADLDTYTYNAAHQIDGFTYDGMGRLTADDSRTYTFDLASRLQSVTELGTTINFTYDGMNMMLSQTAGANVEEYVWNYGLDIPSPSLLIKQGIVSRYFVHLPDGRLLHSIDASDDSRTFYHYDEQGTTLFLTDDAGTITDTYGVTPFGEVTGHTGATDNPFIFSGAYGVMEVGNTGLYYMRHRFYDSRTGRFISRDPAASIQPEGINPYLFAKDNPLSYIDPMGLAPLRYHPSHVKAARDWFIRRYRMKSALGPVQMPQTRSLMKMYRKWLGKQGKGLVGAVPDPYTDSMEIMLLEAGKGFSHGAYTLTAGMLGREDSWLESSKWGRYTQYSAYVTWGALAAIGAYYAAPHLARGALKLWRLPVCKVETGYSVTKGLLTYETYTLPKFIIQGIGTVGFVGIPIALDFAAGYFIPSLPTNTAQGIGFSYGLASSAKSYSETNNILEFAPNKGLGDSLAEFIVNLFWD